MLIQFEAFFLSLPNLRLEKFRVLNEKQWKTCGFKRYFSTKHPANQVATPLSAMAESALLARPDCEMAFTQFTPQNRRI